MTRQRFFLLYWPLFSIFIVCIQLIFFSEAPGALDPARIKFIDNVIFMSSTHLVFPYALVCSIPSFMGLAVQKVRSGRRMRWALVLFVVVAYFLLVVETGENIWLSPLTPFVQSSLFWFWILVPVFHGLKQSGGLCLLYNQTDPEGKEAEPQERKIVHMIVFTTLATLIFTNLKWSVAAGIFYVLATLSGLALLVHIKRQKAFHGTDKMIFSARFFLWPMMAYSSVAVWLIGIMHAHEYIFLMQKILDKYGENVRRRFFAILAGMVGLVLLYCSYEFGLSLQHENMNDLLRTSPLLGYVLLLFPVMTAGHYFLDGLIYRMRDADVRRHIRPDLIDFHEEKRKVALDPV